MIIDLIIILLEIGLAVFMIWWVSNRHKEYSACEHDGERMEIFFRVISLLLLLIYIVVLLNN